MSEKGVHKPMGRWWTALSMVLTVGFVSSMIPVCAEEAVTTQTQTPEQVVQAYYTAMRSGAWQQWASLFHPKATQKFKAMIVPAMQYGATQAQQAGELAEFLEPFGVKTVEELTALSPPAFMAGFMSGLVSANPAMKESLSSQTAKVIGAVDEGPIKHVVVRMFIASGGATVNKVAVISLEQDGATWRVQLTGEIENLAAAFRARAR